MKRPLELALWCDCETDEEKAIFVKSGRAVETGVIAPEISYEVGQMFAQSVRMRDALELCRAMRERGEKTGGHACLHSALLLEVEKICEEAMK